MFLSVSESRLLLSTLEAQHPPTCPSLFHPFVTVIRTKFIDLSTKREMSYHQPGAPLFSFRGEKRFRVFQPPQRRHPFSPIFFSCFSPFFRTRFIIISISSLHLLSPSFLFVRWSFPFGENNSILLIDQNIRTRGIVIAWYALNFHLKIWSSSERTKFILYTLDIFSGGIGGHPVCAWIGIKVNGDYVFRIGWHEFMGWRVIKI